MMSNQMSPLDKLYSLQFLSIMDGYDKADSNVLLNLDDNIHIMTYIIIQSGIPDLAS